MGNRIRDLVFSQMAGGQIGLGIEGVYEIQGLIRQHLPSSVEEDLAQEVAMRLSIAICFGVFSYATGLDVRTNGNWGDASCVLSSRVRDFCIEKMTGR